MRLIKTTFSLLKQSMAFILLLGILFLTGCPGDEPEPVIELTTNSMDFTSSRETKSLTIESNTRWTVNSSESWLTVSPSSGSKNGTVSVTAAENQTTTKRTATITVSKGEVLRTINVTQEGIPVILELSTSSMGFSYSGDVYSLTISSNVTWTVSSSVTWLTVSPSSGSNNGTLTVTAQANSTSSRRSGVITVRGGGITQTVNVSQSGPSPRGDITFWSDIHGSINISFNGRVVTFTGGLLSGVPNCGANNTAYFTNLLYGTYFYSAFVLGGSHSWSGYITLDSSCLLIKLQ